MLYSTVKEDPRQGPGNKQEELGHRSQHSPWTRSDYAQLHSPRRRTLVQAGLDKGLDQNFVVVVVGGETVTVVKTPQLEAAQP